MSWVCILIYKYARIESNIILDRRLAKHHSPRRVVFSTSLGVYVFMTVTALERDIRQTSMQLLIIFVVACQCMLILAVIVYTHFQYLRNILSLHCCQPLYFFFQIFILTKNAICCTASRAFASIIAATR